MTQPMGVWEPTLGSALSIVGVHAIVLHTGKVLYFSFDAQAVNLIFTDRDQFVSLFNNPELGSYQVWDPATGTAGPVREIGRNSFCAGQCALPDGTILVAGGQDGAGAVEIYGPDGGSATDPNFWSGWLSAVFGGTDNGALKDLHTYDPVADAWHMWPALHDGRYYPTCALLPDGTAFIAGGLSNLQQWVATGSNSCENDQFETVPPGELFAGPTPQQQFRSADQYPIIRLLPGSQMLFVHIETQSFLFDLQSKSFVQNAVFAPPGVGRQTYPMQTGHVLLPQKEGDTPRILIVGGSTANGFDFDTHSDAPAVQLAFIFTFDAQHPRQSSWRQTNNPPGIARLLCDTVLLPDGTVFIVNGIQGGAAAGNSQATVNFAEIFDPSSETFTTMNAPDGSHPRGYHSTAVLLPDARVAIAGNTAAYNKEEGSMDRDDVSIQIFDPPYLFEGPRPMVTGAPSAPITYGSTITFSTSGGPDVTSVMMMRPCAVTHTVDMDQRAVVLQVSARSGAVDVTFPTDQSLAPPGFYMLFFLSAAGVPSLATWMQIQSGTPTFPPLYLGTYSGDCVIEEVFDGDLTLEKIDQGAKVTLTSRHGSITIKHKIDQHSYANLTAATTISIGEKIDQQSIAILNAGGDVTIGQSIDQGSNATITSTSGKIDIGQKIDATSGANLTAGTTVHIGQTIDQHSNVQIMAQGDVSIDEKIDQHATAVITSVNGAINIGQKVDQWAIATLTAQGNINIGQKLDQHTSSTITSVNGSVTVSQGMSGNCTATITANNGAITMDTIDGGSTLNWSAESLNCPHQNGTVNHI